MGADSRAKDGRRVCAKRDGRQERAARDFQTICLNKVILRLRRACTRARCRSRRAYALPSRLMRRTLDCHPPGAAPLHVRNTFARFSIQIAYSDLSAFLIIEKSRVKRADTVCNAYDLTRARRFTRLVYHKEC